MQKTVVVTQSTHTEFLSLTEIKLSSCKILPYGALRMNIIYRRVVKDKPSVPSLSILL